MFIDTIMTNSDIYTEKHNSLSISQDHMNYVYRYHNDK